MEVEDSPKEKINISRVKMKHFFKGDGFIWFFVLILMLLSLIFIFSSSTAMVYKYRPDSPGYYFLKRAFHIFIGAVTIFIVYPISAKHYYKWSPILYLLAIILLIVVEILGVSVNGANRALWGFQPSDFAKIAMIVELARLLTKYKDIVPKISFLPFATWISMLSIRFGNYDLTSKDIKKKIADNDAVMTLWKRDSWKFLAPIFFVCVLVLPSNLSTTVIIAIMGIAVLLFGGIRLYEILKLTITAAVVGITALYSLVQMGLFERGATWLARLGNFGGYSYQAHHAKMAIAQGWLPKGPGSSLQRTTLPRAESDFMFAFIIEEYSLIGGISIILLYIWFFQRAIVIAKKHNDRFEALVAVGIAFFICFQALVHMLVNVGIGPVTGLVLPFLSNGGSAIVSMSMAIAIILNISMHQRKIERKENEVRLEREENERVENERIAREDEIKTMEDLAYQQRFEEEDDFFDNKEK